jgi:hypothetical protein
MRREAMNMSGRLGMNKELKNGRFLFDPGWLVLK